MVPLAPRTDESGLEHSYHVGILAEQGCKLTDVSQHAALRGIGLTDPEVVGEAKHDFETCHTKALEAPVEAIQERRIDGGLAVSVESNVAPDEGVALPAHAAEIGVGHQIDVGVKTALGVQNVLVAIG